MLAALGFLSSGTAAVRPPNEPPPAPEWVRAGLSTNRPLWGIRGGLIWGLPVGKNPPDGPRGLIRLHYPVLTNGGLDLVNFIAVEPVVAGRRGFSELERSALDGVAGKRMWAQAPAGESAAAFAPGELARLDSGGWQLSVEIAVERFDNGAAVSLWLRQHSERPDELELVLHSLPDSAPIDCCILSATMGNKARTRLLWLGGEVVSSLRLYPDYRQADFAPHRVFAVERLHRSKAGEVIAAVTTDEVDPSAVEPFPGLPHWRYAGMPVTQYWRKPAGTWRADLQVAVNGRYTYWMSRRPIPGGIAFENFEMRERFFEGQRFVFGITRKTPPELGFHVRPATASKP